MKIKKRFPNYVDVDDCDKTEHEFNTFDQLKEIDWIDRWTKKNDFHQFSISLPTSSCNHGLLMCELDSGYRWWVIGIFIEPLTEEFLKTIPVWKAKDRE